MAVTPSVLASFNYCVRKLFLDNVLRILPPPKDVMKRGEIIHEFQEKIFRAEQRTVEKITSIKELEELKNYLKREYHEILAGLIQKHRPEIDRFSILSSVLSGCKVIIDFIADERGTIIYDTISSKNVLGEELWLEIFPKIKSEISLESKDFDLRGRIDRIEIYPEKIIPVEIKSGNAPEEGMWESHKIQLAAYLIMMNEQYGEKIDEGTLYYTDTKAKRTLFLNPALKDEIRDLISKVKSILNSDKLPDFCTNKKKCEKCGLKNFCYDEEFISQKMDEKFGG